MGEVREFKRRPATATTEAAHLAGEAFCMRCNHTWSATAPVGTLTLDCPSCGSGAGYFKFPCAPNDQVWECQCGNQFFHITQRGHFCPNCGALQSY
jgi:rubrerythrin